MANISSPSMQELLEAGVHFGHKVSRGHPMMKQFIYGAREGVHIIDLSLTESKLKEALEFVYNLGKSNGVLLIVASKKQARELSEVLAKEADTPYITFKWVGGLLTNFDEIRKNLNKLNALKSEQEKGELIRYTKKEQLLIRKKLEKYQKCLGGVAQMTKLPDALFIVDIVTEDVAIKEANRVGIKTVGFADTNSNPNLLDYPIPANDDGIKSLKIITEAVMRAYIKGKGEREKGEGENRVEGAGDNKKPDGVDKKDEIQLKDEAVKEETAVLEEEVEKKVLEESKGRIE